MAERTEMPGRRLTIFVGETHRWHHRPLYVEIVHRAHQAGLAGATVVRGMEGFGSSRQLHTTRLLSLYEDLPCQITIVDSEQKIDAFLPTLDELIDQGLVVIDDVRTIVYGEPVE